MSINRRLDAMIRELAGVCARPGCMLDREPDRSLCELHLDDDRERQRKSRLRRASQRSKRGFDRK